MMFGKPWRGLGLLVAGLLVCGASAMAATPGLIKQVVAFGDSNIDNGNSLAYVVSRGGAAFPVAPYAQGRHSNGLLYVERVANGLGLSISASANGGFNYAIGGAVTAPGAPWGTLGQVESYLQRVGWQANPDALYVVQTGDNDVEEAVRLYAATGNLAAAQAKLDASFGHMRTLLDRLQGAGARHFLVGNVFDIGRAPNWSGTPYRWLARELAARWNYLLDVELDELSQNPGVIQVQLMEVWGLVDWAHEPWNTTFTTKETACLRGGVVCAQPAKHIFWDGIHLTTQTHARLAAQALVALR